MFTFVALTTALLLADPAPAPERYAVAHKGKWGAIDAEGKLQIPLRYNNLEDFHDGLADVEIDGKYGYIDVQGNLVIPATFDWAMAFSYGIASVKVKDQWGIINKKGEFILKPQLGWAHVSAGAWPVLAMRGEQGMFLNEKGKPINDLRFDEITLLGPFSHGMHGVRVGELWGYVSPAGEFVIKPQAGLTGEWFREGLAGFEAGELKGYIDTTGKRVIDAKFVSASSFHDGVAWVKLPKLDGFAGIDRTGRVLFGPVPEWVGCAAFSEGRGAVLIENKQNRERRWAIIDKRGAVVVDFLDEYGTFHHGLAAVARGDKWGYIDPKGRTAIKFEFDAAGDFEGKLARVWIGDVVTMIDKTGKAVWMPK